MWPGTYGMVDIVINGWSVNNGGSYARHGFHVDISDDTKAYNLTFSVEASTEDDKKRGPFTNDKDYCWKMSGSIDNWKLRDVQC
jgi:hypothetical protein